jgi:hypothetical protein
LPGNLVPSQVVDKTVSLEARAFENPIGGIDSPHQLTFYCFPAVQQPRKGWNVDRHAGVFHRGHGGHVAASQESPGKIDPRRHRRQEPHQGVDVLLAVVQDRYSLLGIIGTTGKYPVAHAGFLSLGHRF